MRHAPIPPSLFTENRARLRALMRPRCLAVVNNNDALPTNADGTFRLQPNSDLLYLTGIAQEESVLLLFPDAHMPRDREILFLRDVSPMLETWEGKKLTREAARKISGVKRVEWLSSFERIFRALMCEAEGVYLNQNEHPRAVVTVETREARFVADTIRRYPLHEYHRLARLLHALRAVKSKAELALLQRAIEITRAGFERAARFTRPGVNEMEVEAEFIHEFTRRGGAFAYTPIIATGLNATGLHYIENSARCRDGEMLLLDVASSYAHYNADLTRTIPVNGRFTRRQRAIYEAVLRVFRATAAMLRPGLRPVEWRAAAEELMEKELVDLKLLKMSEVKKQGPDKPAMKRYFMHNIGHPIGLDVHDVQVPHEPMQAGWVVTCEPGIYIPEEKIGVRLENMILITENDPIDLMADIPIEPGEIEALMAGRKSN
jgi:Xaa-Pro aminopeptidase